MSRFIRLSDVMDEGSPDFTDEPPDPAPPTGDGEFWRSPSGYRHPGTYTVLDALAEAMEEGEPMDLLNMARASGLPLDQIPANECAWVSRDRAIAETYNRDENGQPSPDLYSFRPNDYRVIIPDDGDGGMYIWTPGMGSQARTRPIFIRLATHNVSRQRGRDTLLQARYDAALAEGRSPDDPFMRELRARIKDRKLNTREQGVLSFPETDEPWASETNPAVARRMKLDYIHSVNDKLKTLGGRMSSEERGEVDRLNSIILMGTDRMAVSRAHSEVDKLMRDLETRPDPEPYQPRFVSPIPITGATATSRFVRLSQENPRLSVFRGVGARGLREPRPSNGGVYGPGYYMYRHPLDARSYAGAGGGIIVGTVPSDTKVNEDGVVVVDDLGKLHIVGHVPTENTLDQDEIMRLIREMGIDPGERYRGR